MLHGDISLGNILLVDDPQDGSFVGFIHDFDYSSMTKAPPTDEDRQNGMLGRKDEHDAIGEEVTVSVVLFSVLPFLLLKSLSGYTWLKMENF